MKYMFSTFVQEHILKISVIRIKNFGPGAESGTISCVPMCKSLKFSHSAFTFELVECI